MIKLLEIANRSRQDIKPLLNIKTGLPAKLQDRGIYKRLPEHYVYPDKWNKIQCPICHIFFFRRKSDKTKYCSNKCYHTSRMKRPNQYHCEHDACSDKLILKHASAKHGKHIFCSNYCRAIYYHQQIIISTELKNKALRKISLVPIQQAPAYFDVIGTPIPQRTYAAWGDDYWK